MADRVGQGVLFSAEAGHETAAAHLAAVLAPTQHAQQVSPRRQTGFARQDFAEHHAVAAQQHVHDSVEWVLGGVRRFRGRRQPGIDQVPTARLVERMQPPARAAAALVALEQRPQSGEAVRGDQPRRGQFGQAVFELGGEQPGLPFEVVEELRPAVAQHRVHPTGAGRE